MDQNQPFPVHSACFPDSSPISVGVLLSPAELATLHEAGPALSRTDGT